MLILGLLLSISQGVLLFALLYHYFLLLSSIPPSRNVDVEATSEPKRRFALVIPAHNEASVIGKTVQGLRALDYPSGLFDIFVVADHCEDQTAKTVVRAGGLVYERCEGQRGRKGYALAWLLEQILKNEQDYDAFIVFDADSRVSPNFLAAMNDRLEAGALVLQGQHIISNANESHYNRMAAVDMRLNNRLRNAARHNLGSSARLMGDAMCFAREVIEKHPWSTFSLVEDMEYGLHLLLNGIRVTYVAEAVSYGQAAGGWRSAERQRLRWEGGVLDLRRRLTVKLLASGVKQRSLPLLDRGIELILPPFSMLAILTLLLLTIQWLMQPVPTLFSLTAMSIITAAWVAFPFAGLLLDRAPLSLFVALAYGPLYLVWRLFISTSAFVRGQSVQWVRTPRHEES